MHAENTIVKREVNHAIYYKFGSSLEITQRKGEWNIIMLSVNGMKETDVVIKNYR